MGKKVKWLILLTIGVVLMGAYVAFVMSNNNVENSDQQPEDSDEDGYPDEIDDFPNDRNFHRENLFNESVNQILLAQGEWGWQFYVNESVKRVRWEWNASESIVVWVGFDNNTFTKNRSSFAAYHWFNASEKKRLWFIAWRNPYSDHDVLLWHLRIYLDE